MAGAGKRTFIAGEVLTAAQVNDFLMDQAVMRFSGSAARAASITAPTEGMVTYLDDANRLYIYDGAAWQEVEMASDDLRNLVSASGDMLVSIGSGSIVRLPVGSTGQVLAAAPTASTGVQWVTPSGAGDAVYLQVAATGVTALPASIGAGFYRIATNTTTTWTDEQWRFVDFSGNLYGANISNGTGFFTLPVDAASLNITTGTTPFTVLIEEIAGVTSTLISPVAVSSFTWTAVNTGSFAATTAPTAASIGTFNLQTGKFLNLGSASVRTGASIVSGVATTTLGAQLGAAIVQANPAGVWGTASAFTTPRYPWQQFTGNGTYTKPAWSSSVDVLVVAGGGGGGGNNPAAGGGGGAGGASLFTNVATPSPVSVTVGAGGAVSAAGSNSSFGPLSTTGGGRGGGPLGAAGTGGSGGGGGSNAPTAGAAGTAGQGSSGGTGYAPAPFIAGLGGGGGGVGGAGGNSVGPTGTRGAPGSGSVVWAVSFASGGQGGRSNQSAGGTGSPFGGGGGGAGYFEQGRPGNNGLVLVRAL